MFTEFQAVVLAAGSGTRFTDLVGNRPKCLLQMGVFPLIYYPLQLLQKYGFQEAIVIVMESQRNEIAQKVEKLPLNLKCDFVTMSSENAENGTAATLRLISEKIKHDVLLISCDIVTDVDFYPILNMFRKNDSSIVSLFVKNSPNDNSSELIIPGPKSKYKPERDLVGINPENDRLLFLASTSDFEVDLFSLPAHLLRSHAKVVIHSDLVDAHIYLFKKWVVDYLAESDKFSTIKGELLPFIIKKQMSRPFVAELGFSESNFDRNDIFGHVKQDQLEQKVLDTNLNNFSRIKKSHDSELIKCHAFVAPKGVIGIRVNTIMGYCIANKKILSMWESFGNGSSLVSSNASISSTQISDCAVAENTTLSEKTSFKSTIFGTNCFVDQKTRIADSYIMNHVTIEEGVVIENCIVCDKAVIKKGSKLKNCLVGYNFTVQEDTLKDKSHLTGEGFMEI